MTTDHRKHTRPPGVYGVTYVTKPFSVAVDPEGNEFVIVAPVPERLPLGWYWLEPEALS